MSYKRKNVELWWWNQTIPPKLFCEDCHYTLDCFQKKILPFFPKATLHTLFSVGRSERIFPRFSRGNSSNVWVAKWQSCSDPCGQPPRRDPTYPGSQLFNSGLDEDSHPSYHFGTQSAPKISEELLERLIFSPGIYVIYSPKESNLHHHFNSRLGHVQLLSGLMCWWNLDITNLPTLSFY